MSLLNFMSEELLFSLILESVSSYICILQAKVFLLFMSFLPLTGEDSGDVTGSNMERSDGGIRK